MKEFLLAFIKHCKMGTRSHFVGIVQTSEAEALKEILDWAGYKAIIEQNGPILIYSTITVIKKP